MRSWVDTGYLKRLSKRVQIQIFVPNEAHEIIQLLEANNLQFTTLGLPKSRWLHILGRLQWAASTSQNSSLREQRRRVLVGFRAWPQTRNPLKVLSCLLGFTAEFFRFAQASPLGALLALFPPPNIFRHLFVALSSSGRFVHHLEFDRPRPDVMVLPTTGFEPWMNAFLVKLRKNGIKTILVPDNWDNLTSKNSLGVFPDAIVTIGNQVSKNLSTYLGIPLSILHGIGIPKFSAISVAADRRVGAPAKVLFLGFSLPYDEVSTLNNLFLLLSSHHPHAFTLHYKPHPNRKVRSVQESQILPGIAVLDNSSRYVLPELDKSYVEFLHSFDVVIAPPTTMLLEFVLAGRARVIRDLTEDGVHRSSPAVFSKKWLHVRDLDILDLPSGNGPEELFILVSEIIQSMDANEDIQPLKGVLCPAPDSYANNMADLIQMVIAGGSEGENQES